MRTQAILVGLLAVLATGAQALGNLELRAPSPVRVHLDGEYVGETPLLLTNIQPGDHRVQAEDPVTGELRTYLFHSPTHATVSKVLDLAVSSPAPAPVVAPPPAPAPAPQQVVYLPQPRPAPVARPVPSYRTVSTAPRTWTRSRGAVAYPTNPHGSQAQKAKVHTRNTLLGLTAATQIFTGNSRDRKRQRNVGLGLLALNEIFR